jgi:CRISPR-associated protein Cmr6
VVEVNSLLRALEIFIDEFGDALKEESSGEAGGARASEREDPVRRARESAMNTLLESLSGSKPSLDRASNYMRELEEAAAAAGMNVLGVDLITRSKMIVGWSPLYFVTEVPLSWDMVLDVPYVPASTVKGILRSAFTVARDGCADALFGTRGGRGLAIFFDAYPVGAEGGLLDYDVITPHYRDIAHIKDEYDVQPQPVLHLVVGKGVRFRAVAAYRAGGESDCDPLRSLLRAIYLSARLGWGRRTSRGYGILRPDPKSASLRRGGDRRWIRWS